MEICIIKDLYDLRLRGRLPKFIKNFLTGRTFQIRIGSILSDLKKKQKKKQDECVPQGSILSTNLFNIKINNIIKELSPDIWIFICWRVLNQL